MNADYSWNLFYTRWKIKYLYNVLLVFSSSISTGKFVYEYFFL